MNVAKPFLGTIANPVTMLSSRNVEPRELSVRRALRRRRGTQRLPWKGQRCGAGFREEGSEQKVCDDGLSHETCQCGEPDVASGGRWGSLQGARCGLGGSMGFGDGSRRVRDSRSRRCLLSDGCAELRALFRCSEQNPREA